jgi:hypothetical protein
LHEICIWEGTVEEPFVDRESAWPFWNIVGGIGVIALLAIVALAISRARAGRIA